MELVFGCSVNWAEKLENLVPCGFYFPTTLLLKGFQTKKSINLTQQSSVFSFLCVLCVLCGLFIL